MLMLYKVHRKKKKLSKSLKQPASADFWGRFSQMSSFIHLKQQVEKTKSSAEAVCFKLLSLLNF